MSNYYLTNPTGTDNWNLRVNNINSNTNTDLVVESKGTGDVILKTGTTNRITIDDTGVITISTQPLLPNTLSSLGNLSATPTIDLGNTTFGWFNATLTATLTNFTPTGGRIGGQYIIYAVSAGSYTIPTSFAGCRTNLLNSLSLLAGNLVIITITYDGTNYYVSFAKYS